jgi:hypothetical protein
MPYEQMLDNFPVWLIYLGTICIFSASFQTGYWGGQWSLNKERETTENRKSHANVALGAMFGLLGLLIAFTFSIAGGQYDARRTLVIDDANAIGTAYLRAELLPEPERSKVRQLLQEYIKPRHDDVGKNLEAILKHAEATQKRLWAEATAAAEKEPTPIVALFVNSLNQMIDTHDKRVNIALWKRIPGLIFILLGVLSILAMMLLGYLIGLSGLHHLIATSLLVFTYSTVFLLIIDLDRPEQGLFKVNQQPIAELEKKMLADESIQIEK